VCPGAVADGSVADVEIVAASVSERHSPVMNVRLLLVPKGVHLDRGG
jgi:hypothetical protein